MLRKLLLVGMLSIVDQGSTMQVVAAIATSFAFFATHIRTLPYRHTEDNILKATTEVLFRDSSSIFPGLEQAPVSCPFRYICSWCCALC